MTVAAAARRRPPPRLPRGSRLAPAAHVVACARADGLLLLDMRSGRRITLDAFGRRVWLTLSTGPSLAELLVRLRDDDIPSERLAEDVTRLLARWSAGALIIWH